MKKYIISFCVLCMGYLGCKKDSNVAPLSVSIDIGFNISYVNVSNTDLMNPATPNGIKQEDIDIYYLIDGIKTRVYNSNYTFPENFKIGQVGTNSKYFLTVFASMATDDKGISTTYLSIKNHPEDTVRAQITSWGESKKLSKVWFNGILRWDGNGMDTITIIR